LEEQTYWQALIAKRKGQAEIVNRAYVLLSLDENRPGGRLSDEALPRRLMRESS
jgi:hypothetical protein